MRGQAHTLEAFTAAVLVVGGLIFATQATAVTPLSASTSNQHIENQQEATVEGLLAAAEENGSLAEAARYDGPEGESVEGARDEEPYASAPPNAFGTALTETLSSRRIAFNVEVRYRTVEGGTDVEPMVRMGEPSDNAVVATRTVGVYNSSRLTGPDDRRLGDLDAEEFYAPNLDDSELYNLLEVEVTVWRK